MTIKCIAIGNRIMGDDSIGIKVLEKLEPQFTKENIEVVYGETDIDYALSKIDDGDILFIFDSTYFSKVPGTLTFTPMEDAIMQKQVYSQHQPSLISLLKTYKKSISGFIIGIEIKEIGFSLELSDTLERKLSKICDEVSKFIYKNIRGD